LSAAAGESLLAHGIHYALVVGGLVGLCALLLPPVWARSVAPARPRDELERRIELLRANLAEGSLLTGSPTAALTHLAPSHQPYDDARAAPDARDTRTRLTLPLAVVSTLAAAGVHAAVGPAHFAEGVLVGLFFAGCALVQLAWVGLTMSRPGTRLLVAGLVVNLGVLVLWSTTRTVGLPGVLAAPEAVGPWDTASAVWELTAALACVVLLSDDRRVRVRPWSEWHVAAQAWLVASLGALVLLSVSGVAA
jgi:hypothetical protein